MCLFAPAPYYKQNKRFFLGFLFKPIGGLRPPSGLNKKASESFLYLLLRCLTYKVGTISYKRLNNQGFNTVVGKFIVGDIDW